MKIMRIKFTCMIDFYDNMYSHFVNCGVMPSSDIGIRSKTNNHIFSSSNFVPSADPSKNLIFTNMLRIIYDDTGFGMDYELTTSFKNETAF